MNSTMTQFVPSPMASLESLLRHFPPVTLAFAYGSGVFKQANVSDAEKASTPLIDLIFVVDDALAWHRENLKRNAHHYAWVMRVLPLNVGIGPLQQNAVFFNPFVSIDSIGVKYGVIQRDELLRDLREWHQLYIAGRLHKPVRFLQRPRKDDVELQSALDANLAAALRVALHDAPERFDRTELFERITGLSYAGDVRMGLAENPNKVRNIVAGSEPYFQQLYDPVIERYIAEQRYAVLTRLDQTNFEYRIVSDAQRAAYEADLPAALRASRSVATIVAQSSARQTIRSAIASGVVRSVRYLFAKLEKRFR